MLVPYIPLVAILAIGMTSATPVLKNEARAAGVPELPEGLFKGSYNKDGTTTLDFPALNQTFTFQGIAQPPVRQGLSGLEKRASSSCWSNNELNHQGVDRGIQAFRDLFNGNPNARGYLGKAAYSIPYFGYNFDGVYVYFCYNDGGALFPPGDNYDVVDLDYASLKMDQQCGAYRPGYFQWDSPSLWGKCASGTSVCLGGV